MSNQALFEKLDQTTELLSSKLIELIKLSAIEQEDTDAETPSSEIAIATTGATLVNNQTMQLVKGVKDLLVLTRNIREKWLLNQIPGDPADENKDVDTEKLKGLLEKCINEIVSDHSIELNP